MSSSERTAVIVAAMTLSILGSSLARARADEAAPAAGSVTAPAAGATEAWHEGDPVPAGYHAASHVRTGLVTTGAVLFTLTYLASTIAATTGYENGAASNTAASDRVFLFVPAVGPFLQLGNASAAAAVFLVLDGLAQAGGLTMFVYGLATPRAARARDAPRPAPRVSFTPFISRGASGAAVAFRF